MFSILGLKLFCKSKIYDKNFVFCLAVSNGEVARLEVPVDDPHTVDELESLEYLVSYHKHSFEGKWLFFLGFVSNKEVMKRVAQEVHN